MNESMHSNSRARDALIYTRMKRVFECVRLSFDMFEYCIYYCLFISEICFD